MYVCAPDDSSQIINMIKYEKKNWIFFLLLFDGNFELYNNLIYSKQMIFFVN